MKIRLLALLLCAVSILLCSCKATPSDISVGGSSEISEFSDDMGEVSAESSDESVGDTSAADESGNTVLDRSAITEFLGNIALLPKEDRAIADENVVTYVFEKHGGGVLAEILEKAKSGSYYREVWHDLTGETLQVLRERVYGGDSIDLGNNESGIISLGFGGDFSFADYKIGPAYYERGKGLDGIIDSEVVEMMKAFDIMTLNNEYCISDRGSPMAGKAFTFRAPTNRNFIFDELGVDVLGLANNHIYDYGKDAFLDTLDAIDSTGIQRVGAGRDLDEARKPLYYIINGRKIAYICGSRAEKNYMTPIATETTPGVFGIYDDADMCETVKEAKAKADIVILFVHWGAEDETYIEPIIQKQGKNYIDCGADIIIGAHAHNLQGVEFYKGKLIAYNLGNYLFNHKDRDTVLMSVEIDGDGVLTSKMLPLKQKNCYLGQVSESEKQRIRDHITSISVNGYVGSDNVVREYIWVEVE